MKATHGAYGYTTMSAHTRVNNTNSISIAANIKLRKRNCIGVNEKLNIRFNTNGNKIENGILPMK